MRRLPCLPTPVRPRLVSSRVGSPSQARPAAAKVHRTPRRLRGPVTRSVLLWAALNMHFAASPGRRRQLLPRDGSGSADNWLSVLEPLASELHPGWREAARDELDRARRQGAAVLTLEDESYPPLLRASSDPPLLLYVWGELRPEDVLAVSVVGSRRAPLHRLHAPRRVRPDPAAPRFPPVSGPAPRTYPAGPPRA